jgi:hypothetical protein
MKCRKCGAETEGINALCYQCQLDIMNKYIQNGRPAAYIIHLADEYDVRVATIMNILAYFGVLDR